MCFVALTALVRVCVSLCVVCGSLSLYDRRGRSGAATTTTTASSGAGVSEDSVVDMTEHDHDRQTDNKVSSDGGDRVDGDGAPQILFFVCLCVCVFVCLFVCLYFWFAAEVFVVVFVFHARVIGLFILNSM